ncbi:hypothetical protein, partial [Salmonella enterica]
MNTIIKRTKVRHTILIFLFIASGSKPNSLLIIGAT